MADHEWVIAAQFHSKTEFIFFFIIIYLTCSCYLVEAHTPSTLHMNYMPAIQWFRVVYCRISHIYTRGFRRVCMPRKYKGHVVYSAVNHEKSLYNYFIPRHRKFRRESLARDALCECWVVYRRIHNGFPAF